mmetsp:Transcript_15362/g.19251  ORF Transcript_15362/g.19251 Transcript_15362/m.19251 type:complete len:798 (-) Transcript_15362:498-2891(-)
MMSNEKGTKKAPLLGADLKEQNTAASDALVYNYSPISLCACFVAALVCGVVGIDGGNMFIQADYIASGSDHSVWETTNGFTLGELEGGLLQSFFLPLSAIFIVMLAYHSYKSSMIPLKLKFLCYLGGIALCLVLISLTVEVYPSDDILECWVVFCIWSDAAERSTLYGALNFVALMYLSVCVIFFVMFSLLSMRTGWEMFKMHSKGFLTGVEQGKSSTTESKSPTRRMAPKHASKANDVICLLLTFVIFFPFVIFLDLSLPDLWKSFTVYNIQSYAAASYADSVAGKVWDYEISESLVLKLYPDILAFFLFIYIVAIAGLITQASKTVQQFMHARPSFLRGMCIGELSLILLFAGLMYGEFYYWNYNHLYEGKAASSDIEQTARTWGQLANCVTGLLLLPISRNNIWSITFGVSWEAMVKFHRWLGRIMLVIVILHVSFWVNAEGWSILSLPFSTYHSDNFTIPMSVISTVFLILFIGVGTLDWIRRNHFEIFYYSHFVFMGVFIVMLWHATCAWQYILGGLSLWMLDRAIRFKRGLASTHCTSINVYGDVTEISYVIESGGKGPFAGPKTRMQHRMGQYCFVNIPAISLNEWHPYTISSAPSDNVTKHHIKSMGTNSFGYRLNQLALTLPQNKPLENLTVNVDGPYGLQPDYYKYERVMFVAGGIGITPAISCFRELYLQHSAGDSLQKVDLIWTTRNVHEQFRMFEGTFTRVKKDNIGGKFNFKIHATDGVVDAENTSAGSIIAGRPDLLHEIAELKTNSAEAMLFVCGPEGLVQDCEQLSMEYGIDFHAETFIL